MVTFTIWWWSVAWRDAPGPGGLHAGGAGGGGGGDGGPGGGGSSTTIQRDMILAEVLVEDAPQTVWW